MRITELLVENQQQLDEGPLGSLGKAAGKAVGGVAKGIGAVAGGIAGIPGAVKKGFQAGKKTVAGDDAAQEPAAGTAPSAAAKPAQPTAGGGIKGAIDQFKQGFAQGRGATDADQTAEPAAQQKAAPAAAQQPAAAPAAAAEPAQQPAAATAAPAPAAQQPADGQQAAAPAAKAATPYKAAQDAVSKLDKRGKQNLLKLLQKEFPQAAPAAQPAAAPVQQSAAAPAAEPAQQTAAPADDAEARKDYLYGKGVRPKNKEERRAAFRAQNEKEGLTKKKPSQAEIDADRERIMGVTSDSKINTGNPLAEALARKVEEHKNKMFEDSLKKGQVSIFVK